MSMPGAVQGAGAGLILAMVNLSRTRRLLRRAFRTTRWLAVTTRQGALAVAATLPVERAASPARRAAALLAGSILIGIGVASFSRAGYGLPPYDVMLSALSQRTGLSLGQSAWLAAAGLYAVAAAVGQRPRWPAIVFTFTNGLAVDATLGLTAAPTSLTTRVVLVGVGVWFIAGGIALVAHSHSTGGPFELLMNAGAERGFERTRVRTGLEVTVFAIGIAAGGSFGVATIVFALCIGPVLATLLQGLSDHRTGRHARLSGQLTPRA